ncbi:unnamed protein product [Trichobilharzia regenti]|nr:unnamed protein product [Trichobilharzia regenti]
MLFYTLFHIQNRSLAEICMARLIRDWPCMLPPRRSSLRRYTYKNDKFKSKDAKIDEKHCQTDNNKGNAVKFIDTTPLTCHDLPVTVLISLISEAILQRDCAAITGLVANWPAESLIVKQLIPAEEYPLIPNYMTKPTFVLVSSENEMLSRNALVKGPSLLDAFILGMLTRQPKCKLKSIDFTGFEEGKLLLFL